MIDTKELEAVRLLYAYTMCTIIERNGSSNDGTKLEDTKIDTLYNDLRDHQILSAFLLSRGQGGIRSLINNLAGDFFLSLRDQKIYFAGISVELNQFIERVLIQYIPEENLCDDDKRKQRKLLNVREQFVPEWEGVLYRLLLRFIENKSEQFTLKYDDVCFKTALHGLSKNELTAHHFAGSDERVLKALFASIAQDEGFISVDGKLQYQGINIEVNKLLSKVIVPNIPQSFTAVNYSVQGAASSTSLLDEIGGGFTEVGAVVVDFFRTFWNNEEQANGR